MAFDPNVPEPHAELTSEMFREQFNGLWGEIQSRAYQAEVEQRALMPSIAPLTQTISNPPTQAQLVAVQNKLNELIQLLTGT
jgi:hypothetical protein